jgi:hypothetical protein
VYFLLENGEFRETRRPDVPTEASVPPLSVPEPAGLIFRLPGLGDGFAAVC